MSKTAAIARSALIAAALFGAGLSPAIAATSGTLQLTGTVATNCSVEVRSTSPSLNLVAGESSRQVGTVVETCNSGSGYDISVTSANAGKLVSSAPGTIGISYDVTYDGQSGPLNTGFQVGRNSAQFGKESPLAVSLTGSANAVAGTYSDTITITIAAK